MLRDERIEGSVGAEADPLGDGMEDGAASFGEECSAEEIDLGACPGELR